jgi:hypothetical protein
MKKIQRIPIQKFMKAREAWRKQIEQSKGPNDIIWCDPGDEIICDLCNADAFDEASQEVLLAYEGAYLVCKECAEKRVKE